MAAAVAVTNPGPPNGSGRLGPSAAAAAADQLPKSLAELLAEETVNDGVHAAVGGAEPLSKRHDNLAEDVLRGAGHLRLHDAPEVDPVQRQPGEREEHAHDHEHLQHLHLGALDQFRAAVVRAQPLSAPHLEADEAVAHSDHGER